MILLPVPLPKVAGGTSPVISSPYSSGSGTFDMTYQVSGTPTTKTLTLSNNPLDQVQTVVWKIVYDGQTVTSTFSQPANWTTDLSTTATSVGAWVMPMANGTLKAYTVVVYYDTRP
jgi:hypothetical protein